MTGGGTVQVQVEGCTGPEGGDNGSMEGTSYAFKRDLWRAGVKGVLWGIKTHQM